MSRRNPRGAPTRSASRGGRPGIGPPADTAALRCFHEAVAVAPTAPAAHSAASLAAAATARVEAATSTGSPCTPMRSTPCTLRGPSLGWPRVACPRMRLRSARLRRPSRGRPRGPPQPSSPVPSTAATELAPPPSVPPSPPMPRPPPPRLPTFPQPPKGGHDEGPGLLASLPVVVPPGCAVGDCEGPPAGAIGGALAASCVRLALLREMRRPPSVPPRTINVASPSSQRWDGMRAKLRRPSLGQSLE